MTATVTLENLSLTELLSTLVAHDAEAAAAVAAAVPALAGLVERAERAIRAGGRVLYVGAGTSGRLAAGDAAEWEPTFALGASVKAIIAGGEAAWRGPVEGAEDDAEAARQAVAEAGAGPRDFVIGVSASGRTPFVAAALEEARRRGAGTGAIVCRDGSPIADGAEVAAVLAVGPEVLAGSTRLKAGVAQKVALNAFSTAVAVRLGRTLGGRMIDVRPLNAKLRRRQVEIVAELAGTEEEEARAALRASGGDARAAVATLRLGFDPGRLEQAYSLLDEAIGRRVTPGAVALVCRSGGTLLPVARGHATLEPEPEPMRPDTPFDLASLTKVVATAPAVWALAEEGRLRIGDPVCRYVKAFQGGGRERVTIHHLLTHTSGLPAHARFDRSGLDRAGAVDAICRRPLEARPGERVVYSDMGFMLLREVVEAAAGEPFPSYVARRVFGPLGMDGARFAPGDEVVPGAAATEAFPEEGRVRGRVHDENARRVFGGVAGHAGLFATAADLGRYARAILAPWRVACGERGEARGERREARGEASGPAGAGGFLAPATVLAMTRPATGAAQGARRTRGWAMADGPAPTCGDLFGPNAFGHTGFTGTSLWIDPDLDLAVVLLTNRVYFGRDATAEAIQDLRGRFHNAVAGALVRPAAPYSEP